MMTERRHTLYEKRINPILATAYLGKHGINDNLEKHYHNTDFSYGERGYSKLHDHKAREHALYNHAPTGDQSGPRPQLIKVGGGYPRRRRLYY